MSALHLIPILKMARPVVIAAGIIAFVLGAAMAYHELKTIDFTRLFLSLGALILGIMSAHYFDEYADVDTDSKSRRTLISGGSGVLPSGEVERIAGLRAAEACLFGSLALAAAGIAMDVVGPIILPIALIGLVGGWMYSMPPFKLIRRGWGELDNALLGGLIMPLIAYSVQTGGVSAESIAWCIPVSVAVMANLLGIHWEDRFADGPSGKRTLAVILGLRVRQLFLCLVFSTYAFVFVLAGTLFPVTVWLGVAVTLPVGAWAAFTFARRPSLVPGTSFMMVLMVAMTVGWFFAP